MRRPHPSRNAVAVEAARLLYDREFKEYFHAKRAAAARQRTNQLPTNAEVHAELMRLADRLEGEARTERLHEMRAVARHLMELLEDCHPRLIGSTWTGAIRQGSDVDLHLYVDDLDRVLLRLEREGLPYDVEVVHSLKYEREMDFVHVYVQHPSRIPVDMTVYPPDWLPRNPRCSITGGPMVRATLADLRALVVAEAPTSWTAREAAPASRLDMLRLPEVAACHGVSQNHFHHLDVLEHTVEVVRGLERWRAADYRDLGSVAPRLTAHLRAPGPGGVDRHHLVALAGWCHDLGKPATWSLDASGRIRFTGHERVGMGLARSVARRLDLPALAADSLADLVGLHMEPVLLPGLEAPTSRLHRLVRQAGALLPEVLVLSLADVNASRGPAQTDLRLEEHRRFVVDLLGDFFDQGPLRKPSPPITLQDLEEELGLGPGRLADHLLDHLAGAWLDGEFSDRPGGLALAAELLEIPRDRW